MDIVYFSILELISSVLGFFVISIFWILALIKLYKQKDGLWFFFKHFGLALLTCIIISALIILSIIDDTSLGLGVIVFFLGTVLLDTVIYFVWSVFAYFLAVKREKEMDPLTPKEGMDDILDDLQT